jgi:hypothetical protein
MRAEVLRSNTTALPAIFSSLVEALGLSVYKWITQLHQDRRNSLARKVLDRKRLYLDLITESVRILVDLLENNLNDPNKLMPEYALSNRIRIISSREVLASVEGVGRAEPDPKANTVQGLEHQQSAEAVQRNLLWRT